LIEGHWEGGENGKLVLSLGEFCDPWEIVNFIHGNEDMFNEDELRVLGSLTLFMAVRELGPQKGPNAITIADRGIGSFSPPPAAFRGGINSLIERLAPVRSEDQYTIRMAAYGLVEGDLGKVG
jgi:hypothetical protein